MPGFQVKDTIRSLIKNEVFERLQHFFDNMATTGEGTDRYPRLEEEVDDALIVFKDLESGIINLKLKQLVQGSSTLPDLTLEGWIQKGRLAAMLREVQEQGQGLVPIP
jgi:hypothetical protein